MNSEKSGLDPTRIGRPPRAELDKGFEAFSGLRPLTEELRSLNPAELRDLREITIENSSINLGRIKDSLSSFVRYEKESLQEAKREGERWLARFAEERLNELQNALAVIEEGNYSRAAFYFLREARESWRAALRFKEQATHEKEVRFRGAFEGVARQNKEQAKRDLERAAVLAKAIEIQE